MSQRRTLSTRGEYIRSGRTTPACSTIATRSLGVPPERCGGAALLKISGEDAQATMKRRHMRRREFLKLTAAATIGSLVRSGFAADAVTPPASDAPHIIFDRYFLQITEGFLRNAVRTG